MPPAVTRSPPGALSAAAAALPYRDDRLVELPDRIADVADDLVVWKVYLVDLGGIKVDVDDLLPAAADHEERGLLDHIVPDVDDQVRWRRSRRAGTARTAAW